MKNQKEFQTSIPVHRGRKSLTERVIENTINDYNERVAQMHKMDSAGEGAIRKESEKLMEHVLQTIVSQVSKETGKKIDMKRGNEDYFRRGVKDLNGNYVFDDEVQVDYNIYHEGKLIAVVEIKSNLDKCYLKRAVSDFEDISASLFENGKNPSNVKYIIFSGQNAVADSSARYYKTRFFDYTRRFFGKKKGGFSFDTFFLVNGKRNFHLPIYKSGCGFNAMEGIRFASYLIKLVNMSSKIAA